MTWQDSILYGEAGLTFVLSGLNTASMAELAARVTSRARKVAASAVGFVCAGVALESLTFMLLETPSALPADADGPLLAVRTLTLASSAALTLLVFRALGRS